MSRVSFIRLQKVTSKDYNKNSLKWLIKNDYLSECNKYFCNGCLKYAENKLNESNDGTANVENQEGLENSQSNSDSENETIGNSVAYVLKLIKENKLNETETIELCRTLGQLLNKSVYEDCKSIQISKQYTSFGENLDTKQFLSQRPKPLISFITEVTSDSKKKFDYRKEYHICLDKEQLYFIRHFMFIGPFSFAQGLVKWSFSGSKAAHALDGGTTSSGSITTMKNLLCQLQLSLMSALQMAMLMYLQTILKKPVKQIESKKMAQLRCNKRSLHPVKSPYRVSINFTIMPKYLGETM